MFKEFDTLMQKTYFHLSPMLIYLLLNTFLFGCVGSQLWHVKSSSLTRELEPGPPSIGSMESELLDY